MLRLGLLSLTIAILAACGVYGLKNRVHDLERDLVRVERMTEKERIRIQRLRAEWATLSRPERLARLTEAHLELQPAVPTQIVGIADIPLRKDLEQEDGPALVSSIVTDAAERRRRASESLAQ